MHFFCVSLKILNDMLLLLLILCSLSISATTDDLLESSRINELKYSHEGKVTGQRAIFTFHISNSTAKHELGIDSYYFSVTFIGEEFHEKRISIVSIPINESVYVGKLNMVGLEEEEGNYVVCVIFRNNVTNYSIASSRFCHVISVKDRCLLEAPSDMFHNRQIFVLLPFVVIILVMAFLFSCIRDYIYRPRTIDAILKSLPQHHATNLEELAPFADSRRHRQTQPALNKRLREDSVDSINYDPNGDRRYSAYHNLDREPLETVMEDD
ncbi:hypothetical protein I4U23_025295 [Adineta vaga]|nr:hypothetical protein I4U23_025295 [Adineta vaga]